MADHPAADQPDPIAPPDNPDQPLRGPQWARAALANQGDPETKARQIADLPMSEFEGSGFIRDQGQEVMEAIVVDLPDEGLQRDQDRKPLRDRDDTDPGGIRREIADQEARP